MSRDYYNINSWNVICDICGKKRKRSECRMQWDGLLACLPSKCWSPKHPNELPLPKINDGLPVLNARPRPNNLGVYLPVLPITTWETAGLQWDDNSWNWEDDPSLNDMFNNGRV